MIEDQGCAAGIDVVVDIGWLDGLVADWAGDCHGRKKKQEEEAKRREKRKLYAKRKKAKVHIKKTRIGYVVALSQASPMDKVEVELGDSNWLVRCTEC